MRKCQNWEKSFNSKIHLSVEKKICKKYFLFWADLKQHDNQYNDTQHNATQCNDVQHKDTLGNTKQCSITSICIMDLIVTAGIMALGIIMSSIKTLNGTIKNSNLLRTSVNYGRKKCFIGLAPG